MGKCSVARNWHESIVSSLVSTERTHSQSAYNLIIYSVLDLHKKWGSEKTADTYIHIEREGRRRRRRGWRIRNITTIDRMMRPFLLPSTISQSEGGKRERIMIGKYPSFPDWRPGEMINSHRWLMTSPSSSARSSADILLQILWCDYLSVRS